MSTKSRLIGTAAVAASFALLGVMPAMAAPTDPISISAADSAWLVANGVSVSIDSTAVHLTSASATPNLVVWGAGVIAEQDKFAGPAVGSVIPAIDSYPWAHEIGGSWSLNLYADAHTSYKIGGVGAGDYTAIADSMTTLIGSDIYAGGGGIGHDASTLSDCTVNACGVWVSPVIEEIDAVTGDDVLRTTSDARWVQVDQNGSAWENSTGIVWDASTGHGTRLEFGVINGFRAQSTGVLASPWLAPARPTLPAPATSTVNPDGTISIGISNGGVANRIEHIFLNLGLEGGQTSEPVVNPDPTPAPDPTPEPVVTPEPVAAPVVTPEPTPEAPVLRFETGEFTATPEGMPMMNLAIFLGGGGLVLAAFTLITRTRTKKVEVKK